MAGAPPLHGTLARLPAPRPKPPTHRIVYHESLATVCECAVRETFVVLDGNTGKTFDILAIRFQIMIFGVYIFFCNGGGRKGGGRGLYTRHF